MNKKKSSCRKYPVKDIKILYGQSAGRCAFPNCRAKLVLEDDCNDGNKQIGEIAHIAAHSPNGPRSDKDFPKDLLDTYDNWILLCPTCHSIIDEQPKKYPAKYVKKIKSEHESWVSEQLEIEMSRISFAELEIATKAIATGKHQHTEDLQIIPTEEKIKKNNLSNSSKELIRIGLSRANEVRRFITSMANCDDEFPIRLIAGFRRKYDIFRKEFSGDELFQEMVNFSKRNCHDFIQEAASLALLSYFFHLCEVFEK